MDTRQKKVLLIMTRVQCFLDRHSRAVGAVNQSRARRALDDLVCASQFSAAAQEATMIRSRSQTARRRELRERLRSAHLRPIVAFLRAHEDDRSIHWRVRMPAKGLCDLRFLAEAEHISRVTTEHRRAFVEQGFAEDFVERLVAAIEEVRKAEADSSQARLDGRCATVAITELTKRARGLLRVIDALVVAQIADDAALLAAWKACLAVKNLPSGPRVPADARK